MHDGNAAHARTAGQSRSATDGRSIFPDVVSPDAWQNVRDFDRDCGVGTGFGLSAFLRDGDRVFRSYGTTGRGVECLRFDLNVLDLTPLGRQEDWEDSPAGWPQTAAYWWRLHDEYVSQNGPAAS